MRTCPKCQLEYDDKFAFCSKCGVPLVAKPQEYFCPTCGKSLGEKYDSFCPYCGQSFEDNSHNSSASKATSTVTTTITNYNLDVARGMLQRTEKQQVNKQPPKYNGKWIGFKGRISRKDFVSKALVLCLISLIILLILPSEIERSNLIYNLRYFTSYYDSTLLMASLNTFMFLGAVQIIVGLLLFGLLIRRFRDMGITIWVVIGTYILAMIFGYFFSKHSFLGNIITYLPLLYGYFAKSIYEEELFENKYVESNVKYAFWGILIVTAISFYSLKENNDKYMIPIQQAMSPNGYWIYIEDTCFIRIPALNKDAKGLPAYQKSGTKKITLKELSIDNNVLIASGNEGTKVHFQRVANNFPELHKATVYSSDILKNNEEDRENRRKKLAEGSNYSIDDVIVNKSYKPEKLGATYAFVLDYVIKKKGSLGYYFVNKQDGYYIFIDYPINENNKFQDLDIQSLENMVKNIIWKI